MRGIGRLVLVAAAAIAVGAAPGLAGTNELGTVRLGWGPWMSDAPVFVAMAKGYFEAEGVKLETESFSSGAKMMQPLTLGQLDAASGGVTTGLFNAVATGAVKDPEIVGIISRYSKVPEGTVRAAIPAYTDNEGRVDVESMAAVQDWLHAVGAVKQKVPIEKVVDMTLLW